MSQDGRPWSPADDYYLIHHCHQYTPAMLAEDLGRTPGAIEGRLRVLRQRGTLERVRAGKAASVNPMSLERCAVAESVREYLAHQVRVRRLSLEQAVELAARIKELLQMPDDELQTRLNWPVTRWVEAVA